MICWKKLAFYIDLRSIIINNHDDMGSIIPEIPEHVFDINNFSVYNKM
jgi:hypothetical protein